MISVIIPLFNKEKSIVNTLQSVLMQTHQPSEIVIVDDGSTDGSLVEIRKIQSPLIRIVKQENRGVSAARNLGIKEAKSKWLAFMDADDLWDKNHLELLYKLITKYPAISIFTSGSRNETVNHVVDLYDKEIVINDYFLKAKEEKIINSSACVINNLCFKKVGLFNENLTRGEDLEMWYRLSKEYAMVKNQTATVVYRLEAENRAMNKIVPYEESFASVINLKNAKSREERLYLKYQIKAKYKSCLYNKEWQNLWKCFRQHKLSFI